ncbi:RNA polymerase sigma factor [Paenibacillus motobuensis]|uniref:RNA polymerase sigma factor n=1 Tax=Paenibacillus TaxID=44249 RepID=UPI00203E712D|nr:MULTISPECIES: RNA polymerase sigma factor [Paenibacillus]MCM3039594.1 RNA polymerase sigma factor [Paenibacillus lutimineralis]MCM3646698.1 RNA polymerase sigma factor [Paenibacillus motobuensis]
MEVENEQWLMDEIRQGNKDAFRTLVDPLIPKAYRTAYLMLQSKPLAEEAVQNALIELYSSIVCGKEINRLNGWFSRLLAHRAVDIARKEQGYKITVDIDDMEIQDAASTPLENLLRKEQSERLFESIITLELNQRIVVGLYYFQELKIEEIATLLDIKEGTVKSRLYHARQKLSAALQRSQGQAKELSI